MWVAVSKAEANAVKLERQGEVEEAAELRAHANSMRYEDPYTALQDQLDEAVKNEVITVLIFFYVLFRFFLVNGRYIAVRACSDCFCFFQKTPPLQV